MPKSNSALRPCVVCIALWLCCRGRIYGNSRTLICLIWRRLAASVGRHTYPGLHELRMQPGCMDTGIRPPHWPLGAHARHAVRSMRHLCNLSCYAASSGGGSVRKVASHSLTHSAPHSPAQAHSSQKPHPCLSPRALPWPRRCKISLDDSVQTDFDIFRLVTMHIAPLPLLRKVVEDWLTTLSPGTQLYDAAESVALVPNPLRCGACPDAEKILSATNARTTALR